MADENSWRPGDGFVEILRKILNRLSGVIQVSSSGGSGAVTIDGDVAIEPSKGALTDGSGTIATGGASQQIFAANTSRKYFFFENVSSGDLWINFGTAAAASQPSIKVLQNGSFVMEASFVSDQAINVIGATTSQAFVAKQA